MRTSGWRRGLAVLALAGASLAACGGSDVETPAAPPGTHAGLFEPGDVLIAVDGRPVKTRAEVTEILRGLDPQRDQVELTLERRGRRITLQVDPRTR